MRTITIQADPAMGDEWLVHTIVAMPVMPNNGFIFDDDSAFSSHVNRRQDGVWTVSFRNPGVTGYPRTGPVEARSADGHGIYPPVMSADWVRVADAPTETWSSW